MKYEISQKGNDILVKCEAKQVRVAEEMCKILIEVINNMNQFKPEATVEYRGVEFDVEFESSNVIEGDQETNERTYTVTKIGLNGLLLDEDVAQALNVNIYGILSEELTEFMNRN